MAINYREEKNNLLTTEQLEEKRSVLLRLYTKSVSRRLTLEQLADISIDLGYYEDANKYIDELKEIAPQDIYIYILDYKLAKIQNEELEYLTLILEELKQFEYIEKWGYELAELYHKQGENAKCIKECKELILWFGSGQYVDKAKELLEIYEPSDPVEEMDDLLSDIEAALMESLASFEMEVNIDDLEIEEPKKHLDIDEDVITEYTQLAIKLFDELDYSVSETAIGLLRNKIKDTFIELDQIHEDVIKDIVNYLINNSERRAMKNLLKIVSQKRYLESELLVICEKDFY